MARFVILLMLLSHFGLYAASEGITVSPTTLIINPQDGVTTLRLKNRGKQEAVYELAGYSWALDSGRDVLTLERAFVATPPVVTLAPGEERIVRIGLLSTQHEGPVEQAYRLRISQLEGAPAQGIGLNVRLQMLLPVFIEGAERKPQLSFDARKDENGSLCIAGRNDGYAHAKLVWVADAEAPEQKIPVQRYVLAQSDAELCAIPGLEVRNELLVGVTTAYQGAVEPYRVSVIGD